MRNTWIDLTDLMAWKGHFTGIQRVLYSYAVRFAAEGAKFFAYDVERDRLVEISFEDLKAKSHSKYEQQSTITKRQLMKRSIKQNYYEKLPKHVKNILRPGAKALNEVFRKYAALLLDNRLPDPFKNYPTIDLPHGSTLLFLGAGWHETGTIRKIAQLKTSKRYRVVQHINDVLPIVQPHLFSDELPLVFSDYLVEALAVADLVTVISEATRHDLKRVSKGFGISYPPIKVIRLGEDVGENKLTKPTIRGIAKDYILAVGTFEIRKNYSLLYQAVKLAVQEKKPLPQMIIVGKKGWLTDDLRHVIEKDPEVKDRILHIPNATDAELNWLYKNCMFSVFPSLCEGWGLPIAESLRHGKLCLASGVSSMLEIAPEFTDYFSPYDPKSCLAKLREYIKDAKYEITNKRIAEQYKPFTWDDSYKQLKEAVN